MKIRRVNPGVRFLIVLVLALTLICIPSPVKAAACVWTGSASTDWSNGLNWSDCDGGVPASGDTVTIPNVSNQPVIASSDSVTVNGLTIESGAEVAVLGALSLGNLSGDGDLTVNTGGALSWTGGTWSGGGITTIASGASLEIGGSAIKNLNGRRLDNYGSATWISSGWNIVGSNGAVFNNRAGASFDSRVHASFTGGVNASFNNAGTFIKSVGGTSNTIIDLLFTNSGTLQVVTGTVILGEDGTHTGESVVAAGSTLDFMDGDHALQASSSVTGGGIVNFRSATVAISGTYNVTGTTQVSGGTVTFNGSAPMTTTTLIQSSGTLTGPGDVTVNGSMTWNGGTQSGNGTTTIASGASLEIGGSATKSLNGRRLDNYGSATWISSGWNIVGSNGAVFNNRAGASFDSRVHASFTGGVNASFNNAGSFIKSAGGTSDTIIDLLFTNSGTLQVVTGTMILGEDGTHTGGLVVAAGSTLDFMDGNHALQASSSVTGGGTVNFRGGTTVAISGTYNVTGTTQVSGGTVTFNGSAPMTTTTLIQSSGTLTGPGDVTVNGSMTWNGGTQSGNGTTTIASGASLEIGGSATKSLNGRRLDNYGSATWISSGWNIVGSNGAVFNNLPGASFDSRVNASFTGGVNARFNNAGTFIKSAGGTSDTIIDLLFTNSGTLQVVTGTMILGEDGTHTGGLVVAAGSTLDFMDGNHALQASSSVTGGGTVNFRGGTTVAISGTYNVTGTTQVSGGIVDFNQAVSVTFGTLTQSGGTLNLDNVCNVTGNFTRTAGTFNHGAGTLNFSGATTQNLSLSQSSTFQNLSVITGTTLIETVANDNANVNGTLTNFGVIRKARSVTAGTVSFGLTQVEMDVVLRGSLTAIQVDRMDINHPNATGSVGGSGLMTGRYWTIAPTGGGYTLTINLPHDNLTDPRVCRYTGSGNIWDCDRTAFTTNTVTRQGITTLSDWAVGERVGPTAITLARFAATSSPDLSAWIWLILAFMLGFSFRLWRIHLIEA